MEFRAIVERSQGGIDRREDHKAVSGFDGAFERLERPTHLTQRRFGAGDLVRGDVPVAAHGLEIGQQGLGLRLSLHLGQSDDPVGEGVCAEGTVREFVEDRESLVGLAEGGGMS